MGSGINQRWSGNPSLWPRQERAVGCSPEMGPAVGQLGCIAIFVEQHPGEGDDWIAGAGIGITAGEIVPQVDRG